MRIIWYEHTFQDATDYLDLVLTGDWHLGTACCKKSCIRRAVQRVVDNPKNTRAILMGDLGDYICYKDKRFEPGVLDKDMPANVDVCKWTRDMVLDYVQPLEGQTIACLTGNHELTALKDTHENPMDIVAYKLNAVHLGYSGIIKLRCMKPPGFPRKVLEIFVHHGTGSARTEGAKINKVHAFGDHYEADIYAMGHVHSLYTGMKPILYASDSRRPVLVDKNRHFILTGSALRAHLPCEQESSAVTYVEQAAYPPVPLGWVELRIWPWGGENKQPRIESTEVKG